MAKVIIDISELEDGEVYQYHNDVWAVSFNDGKLQGLFNKNKVIAQQLANAVKEKDIYGIVFCKSIFVVADITETNQ